MSEGSKLMQKRKARRRRRLVFFGSAIVLIVLIPILAISLELKSRSVIVPEESSASPVMSSLPVLSTASGVDATEIELPEPGPESLGEFILTAYCPCVKCCGEWSAQHPSRIGTDYIQKTASGTIPTARRTIGVDPDVIPFGTTVIISGHEYVAEDRGGAVKGNKIDIFFDDHDEALEFGRQTAEVFITNNEED